MAERNDTMENVSGNDGTVELVPQGTVGEITQPAWKSRKWQIAFFVALGFLILSLTGVTEALAQLFMYKGCDAFLSRSAQTSQTLFLSFSVIKAVAAMVGDVPIVGGLVESVADLIDCSWWGCFISMVVLRVLQLFFVFVDWCGRWPGVVIGFAGCLATGLRLLGIRLLPIRQLLVGLIAFAATLFFLAPLSVRAVAILADALEAQRGEQLEQSKTMLQEAWAWENIPPYMSNLTTELRHKLPNMLGGIGEEEYLAATKSFEEKQAAFKTANETAIRLFTNGVILYLAEKAIACFLFPFAFLWTLHWFTKRLCAWMNLPFDVEFHRLMRPPEQTRTEALQQRVGTFATTIKTRRARHIAKPETPTDAPSEDQAEKEGGQA